MVVDMFDDLANQLPTPETLKATATPTWAALLGIGILIAGFIAGALVH